MTSNPPPVPPLPPSGETLYNAIMGTIEPELMFPQITTLTALYAQESPEQRRARAVRYRKAFEEYEKRYRKQRDWMATQTKTYTRGMLTYVENLWSSQDDATLQNLEKLISGM